MDTVHAIADLLAQEFAMFGSREVVSVHHGDMRNAHAQFLRHPCNLKRRGTRVGGAEVAHDADAVSNALRQDRPQHRVQQRLVSALRIGPATQLRQCQRAFRESLEDEEGALPRVVRACGEARQKCLDDRACGVCPVAGETGGAADQQ